MIMLVSNSSKSVWAEPVEALPFLAAAVFSEGRPFDKLRVSGSKLG
jgi:hypothetical protein